MSKSSKTSPFTYLNSINENKADLSQDSDGFASYNEYIINRSLSYFRDTVLLANEMNIHHHLDKDAQYHFLLNTIRKRKRFSKWVKPETQSDIEVVKEYYGYSNEKAKNALSLLSPEQIEELRKRVYRGGRK